MRVCARVCLDGKVPQFIVHDSVLILDDLIRMQWMRLSAGITALASAGHLTLAGQVLQWGQWCARAQLARPHLTKRVAPAVHAS